MTNRTNLSTLFAHFVGSPNEHINLGGVTQELLHSHAGFFKTQTSHLCNLRSASTVDNRELYGFRDVAQFFAYLLIRNAVDNRSYCCVNVTTVVDNVHQIL